MTYKLIYVIALLFGSITAQAVATFLLPLTRGATAVLPTLGVMASFCVLTVLLSRLLTAGVPLTILIPIISAAGPLAGIAIGTLVYGEAASLAKIISLLAAVGLIVLASFL